MKAKSKEVLKLTYAKRKRIKVAKNIKKKNKVS